MFRKSLLYSYILFVCYSPILIDFVPDTGFGAGIPDFNIERIAILMILFSWALSVAFGEKVHIELKNIWPFLVLIYGIYASLAIFWSKRPCDTQYIQSAFFDNIVPFIILIIAIGIFKNDTCVSTFIKHFMLACAILSLLLFYHAYKLHNSPFVGGDIRFEEVKTFFHNPNLLGIYLVFSVPASLYAMDNNILSKKVAILCLVVIIIGILFTISRKSYFGLGLSALIYLVARKRYFLLTVVIFTLISAFLIASNVKYVEQRFESRELSSQFEGRFSQFKAATRMFIDKPLMGYGYRGWLDNNKKYFKSPSNYLEIHNIYLNALIWYGSIGFLLFISIFVYPLFKAFKMLRLKEASGSASLCKAEAILCLSCVVPYMFEAFFAGGLFQNMRTTYALYSFIALFIAAIMKPVAQKREFAW